MDIKRVSFADGRHALIVSNTAIDPEAAEMVAQYHHIKSLGYIGTGAICETLEENTSFDSDVMSSFCVGIERL